MYLYHGTGQDIDQIDFSFSKDKRDFGVGFYTTSDFNQAKRWALGRFSGLPDKVPLVIKYRYTENKLIDVYKIAENTRDFSNEMNRLRIGRGLCHVNYPTISRNYLCNYGKISIHKCSLKTEDRGL